MADEILANEILLTVILALAKIVGMILGVAIFWLAITATKHLIGCLKMIADCFHKFLKSATT